MRQIVEVRDVVAYFGKSKAACYKTLQKIRTDLGKKARQPISIKEFADYFGFDKDSIMEIIQSNDKIKKESLLKQDTSETIPQTKKTEEKQAPYQFANKSHLKQP